MKKSAQQTQTKQAELNQLGEQVMQLEDKLETAKSAEAQETSIRDELLMQKEDELIVKIEDLEPETTQEINAFQQSPWQEWRELLFVNY